MLPPRKRGYIYFCPSEHSEESSCVMYKPITENAVISAHAGIYCIHFIQ